MSKTLGKKVSVDAVMGKQNQPSQGLPLEGSLQRMTSINKLTPILILVLVSFAVYFNALSGDFVHDDTLQIVNNPWIRDVSNIPVVFSKDVWSFRSTYSSSNYYRPLMHVVYMINYYVFGMTPWGFHLVNILFHCGTVVLVFLVMRTLLSNSAESATPVYLSPQFIAGLLFATHPIHTEAVTWIAGLPDVAFTFLYLLSSYLYIRTTTVNSAGYFLSVASFAVATLFKEPSLTLPAVLYAYDAIVREERFHIRDYAKRYLPYLAVAAVYMGMRIHALGQFAPSQKRHELSAYEYIINVFPLFIQYLGKLIFPLNLNAFYVFHPIHSIFALQGLLSLLATFVFAGITFIALKKSKLIFFGIVFVTAPLLPVLYIPGLGVNTFADRYLYLPSIGYAIILAVFLKWAQQHATRAVRSISILFLLMACLFAVGTVNRNTVWQNAMSLWSDTVKKSPDSSIAHNNYGAEFTARGLYDNAIAEHQIALRLDPEYVDAYSNLGAAYGYKGLSDKAIEEYQKALRFDPDFVEVHYNLGIEYAIQKRLDKAIFEYRMAIFLNPDYAEAHFSLGEAYASQGQLNDAIAEYEAALRIKPYFEAARRHLDDIASGRH